MSPSRVQEAIALFGPVLNQAYGQTEAPSCITLLRKADHLSDPHRLLSCGLPYAGLTLALLDETGEPVPPGAVGEVCVRGPHVMSGYWKQPGETTEAFKHGWLHTGDLASADKDGYVYLIDRKKDVIISGGFNVYPKAVEDTLMSHPAVAIAAVVGVPDPKWGEAVKAFVVLRPGATADAAALLSHVRVVKGAVNTPKSLEFVEGLPLTPLGKPDKKALRSRFWRNRERQIN
jgi:fatty-acyl-CoA synthase